MSTASDKAAYLNMLQGKINTLQFLGSHLEGSQVQILVRFDCGSNCLIEQHLIPFNLQMELRVLIDESIDEWQRMYKNIHYVEGI